MTTGPTGDRAAGGDADIAAVGALLADRSRSAMLLALADGRALPAGRLAGEAGVAASTASSHLGKLVAAGMLAVDRYGRQRYYRLAGPEVARMVETLQQFAPAQTVRSLRQGTRAEALRSARTCYDHLAGRLGVELMGALLRRGVVSGGSGDFEPAAAVTDRPAAPGHDVDYQLTPDGRAWLAEFRVTIPARRTVVRYCVDWTEQRHHLAGGLGRGLLDRLLELGWIRRLDGQRAVRLTESGRAGLTGELGLSLG